MWSSHPIMGQALWSVRAGCLLLRIDLAAVHWRRTPSGPPTRQLPSATCRITVCRRPTASMAIKAELQTALCCFGLTGPNML